MENIEHYLRANVKFKGELEPEPQKPKILLTLRSLYKGKFSKKKKKKAPL